MSHAPPKCGDGRVGSVVLSERHGFLGSDTPPSVRSASRRLRKNYAQEVGSFPGRLLLKHLKPDGLLVRGLQG